MKRSMKLALGVVFIASMPLCAMEQPEKGFIYPKSKNIFPSGDNKFSVSKKNIGKAAGITLAVTVPVAAIGFGAHKIHSYSAVNEKIQNHRILNLCLKGVKSEKLRTALLDQLTLLDQETKKQLHDVLISNNKTNIQVVIASCRKQIDEQAIVASLPIMHRIARGFTYDWLRMRCACGK